MITTPMQSRFSWFARGGALAAGIAACWAGISIAADIGEILVATPLLFIGALGVTVAMTWRLPPRLRRSSVRGTPTGKR